MNAQRIRTYLIALVAACGLGGVVLFIGLFRVEKQFEIATNQFNKDSLVMRDLSRFDESLTQWLVLSDLVLGSDASFVADGAMELGNSLQEILSEIELTRIGQAHQTNVQIIKGFLSSQQRRLDIARDLPSAGRASRLDALLFAMDEEAVVVIDTIEELKLRSTQQHQWDSVAHAELNLHRGFWRGIMLSCYLVFVIALWRWSSLSLSEPLRALSTEASSALKEERRMSIAPGGPLEVQQLTESMSRLVGSLERQVEERTEHLESALNEAKAAVRTKADFLANMSHEIRTPMTAVIGFSERLRDDQNVREDPSRRNEAIKAIVSNGHHLLNLINSILDLSRVEAGKLELETMPVCPFKACVDAVSALRVKADEKQLALDLKFATALPKSIASDPTRLQQILINLIGNAIKFTMEGSVTITIAQNETGDEFSIAVADTGIGIEKEAMDRLFEPFEQADSSMSRRFGGNGLGLSLSTKLAELLHARLGCVSEAKVGSTFTLTHPCDPTTERIDHAAWVASQVEESAVAADEPARLQDLTILVVEDNTMNQVLVESILTAEGATVTLADNGQLGLDAAQAAVAAGNAFDIVLMDMQMPVKDGYTAASELRENDYNGVIIALTGHALSHDRQKCLDSGCDDYATKPIERDALIASITKSLETRVQG